MIGDAEVLAARRGVDLGEDPHPQPVEQGAHLLDVAGVARVDVRPTLWPVSDTLKATTPRIA